VKRNITQEEIRQLRETYLSKPIPWGNYLRTGSSFLKWGLIIGVPFGMLFFAVAFLHKEPFDRCLAIGALGFLPTVSLAVLIFLMGILQANRPNSIEIEIKKDILEGSARIKQLQVVKAWRLIDTGNYDAPDLLLNTNDGRWFCLMAAHFPYSDKVIPKSKLYLHILPKSEVILSCEWDGESIPISDKPIISDNVWRNDGLPYDRLFKANDFPQELKDQLGV